MIKHASKNNPAMSWAAPHDVCVLATTSKVMARSLRRWRSSGIGSISKSWRAKALRKAGQPGAGLRGVLHGAPGQPIARKAVVGSG